MKYCLTGSTGFLGNIILQSLQGTDVITLGRSNCTITTDLTREVPDIPVCDILIHAAGKAHSVPKSHEERQEFYDVNVKGTSNLLAALGRNNKLPGGIVFISSVAVYGRESGRAITEDTPLEASDAYGDSKIQAEKVIREWCEKHDVICTILRLPLIAGPRPPGNLQAMIKGIAKGYYVNIAGGTARKSIVLAEDVAAIIPRAGITGGVYNLTDGQHPSFLQLSVLIAKQLGKKQPRKIPFWLARVLAKAGDLIGSRAPINSDKLRKITTDLTFDDSKARNVLGWKPVPVLENFRIL